MRRFAEEEHVRHPDKPRRGRSGPTPAPNGQRHSRPFPSGEAKPVPASSVVGVGWIEREPGIYYRVDAAPFPDIANGLSPRESGALRGRRV